MQKPQEAEFVQYKTYGVERQEKVKRQRSQSTRTKQRTDNETTELTDYIHK